MSASFCLPHPVAVSAFMICSGLCACTEMLWMCVLYVSFGSKVRPKTFGCVDMGSEHIQLQHHRKHKNHNIPHTRYTSSYCVIKLSSFIAPCMIELYR